MSFSDRKIWHCKTKKSWDTSMVKLCTSHVESKLIFNPALINHFLRQKQVHIFKVLITCVKGTSVSHTEIFKAVASAKGVPCKRVAKCYLMTLEDVGRLPSVDRYYLHIHIFNHNFNVLIIIQALLCSMSVQGSQ